MHCSTIANTTFKCSPPAVLRSHTRSSPPSPSPSLVPIVQVGWLLQLLDLGVRFVWHIDGKHKLHHGKWMLIPIGTHVLARDERKDVVHSFRPTVYLFAKQHETVEAVEMLCGAVDTVVYHFSGRRFDPSNFVITADKAQGLRTGSLSVWPGVLGILLLIHD